MLQIIRHSFSLMIHTFHWSTSSLCCFGSTDLSKNELRVDVDLGFMIHYQVEVSEASASHPARRECLRSEVRLSVG